jgi:hypothetical protein
MAQCQPGLTLRVDNILLIVSLEKPVMIGSVDPIDDHY